MKPERWQLIESLCHSALEIEPGRRDAFLEQACAGDDSLRRQVDELLAHDTSARGLMNGPAMQLAARQLAQDQETPSANDLIGRTIGRYRILAKIGEGGMGEVFLAEDPTLHRKIALKFLPLAMQQDPLARKRFLREAESAAALDHPFICHINEVGESEGRDFIAMEYVPGQMLSDRLQNGSLPVRDALQIASEVAEALEEAHDKGIIHRDLKPANIMLTRKGHAKVMDFGLAKQLIPRADGQEETMTESGAILGTLAYMSPEQLRGSGVDARSDIFSLGVVLYEMLTGMHPFKRQGEIDTAAEILHSAPRSLSDRRRGIPAGLDRVVLKMLAKTPSDRYASVSDVQLALKHNLASVEREFGNARRMKTGVLVTFVALLAIGAIISGVLFFQRQAETDFIPVPLTTYPGSEFWPSFSPDGNYIVFWASDPRKADICDLYVKQIGSEYLRRLTFNEKGPGAWGHIPAWSPDGQFIAYASGRADQRAAIMLIPANGGAERQVAEFRSVVGIGWHPGGRWLAVGGVRDSRDDPGGIYLISPDTGVKRRLTSTPSRAAERRDEDRHPVFSPDGNTLAFVRGAEIYLLPLSDTLVPQSEPKQLTYLHQFIEMLTWTPDGKEIIFASGSKAHDLILWRIAASGSGAPRPLPFAPEGRANSPAISRNHRLVYEQCLSDINIWRCPISPAGGGSDLPSRLRHSTRVQEWARYSPDGKAVAYVAWDSGRGQIWVCDSEGENARQLTRVEGWPPGPPSWSPDGKNLVFVRRALEPSEICTIPAQAGPMQQLTPALFRAESPSYSRDGKWIYFGSNKDGGLQVWKMPANGGPPSRITRNGGTSPLESPDGKTLFYIKRKEDALFSDEAPAELWKVPVQGGKETRVLEEIFLGQYDLGRQGIYFVVKPEVSAAARPAQEESRLLFNFLFVPYADHQAKTVAEIRERVWFGFSVSPDEHSILYTQGDEGPSDLMLVENFR